MGRNAPVSPHALQWKLTRLSKNDGPRSRAAVIVERGQLIHARSRLPAKDLMRVTGADEGFVGEPVQFPDPGFGLSAQRDSRRVCGGLRNRDLRAGQIDLGRMTAAREQFIV